MKGANGTNFRYIETAKKVRRIILNSNAVSTSKKSKLNGIQIYYSIQKKNIQNQENKFNGLFQSNWQRFHWNVVTGSKKTLKLRGVGYKFLIKKQYLSLKIGFSHELNILLASDLFLTLNRKSTAVKFKTTNIGFLSSFLASIKSLRKPDIYKGKGIRYKKEKLVRKEGKKKKTS